MPVQLDVRDVLDAAVRGEDAFLVLAAEERDLDLLAFVLAGVVLHPRRQSIPRNVPSSVTTLNTSQLPIGPLLVRLSVTDTPSMNALIARIVPP